MDLDDVSKKDVEVLIFVGVLSLFLIFCWLFPWFWRDSDLISSVGDMFVYVLARFNLMDYHSHIGGHTAHSHGFVWSANLLISLIYARVLSHIVNKKMDYRRKMSAFRIVVFLISFVIYARTTFVFLIELERFAYGFFVPSV